MYALKLGEIAVPFLVTSVGIQHLDLGASGQT